MIIHTRISAEEAKALERVRQWLEDNMPLRGRVSRNGAVRFAIDVADTALAKGHGIARPHAGGLIRGDRADETVPRNADEQRPVNPGKRGSGEQEQGGD
jgi:hypothetical protein